MQRSRLAPFVAAAALAAGAAQAQSPPPGVEACQACHGAQGVSSSPVIPNLAGQKPAYLAAQLQAFRSNTRQNPLMQAIAGQLGDAEIKAFAAFWAAQAPASADPHANPNAITSRMTLPADFPTGFLRYQALPPADGAGAVERYANAVAVQAVRAGRPLPDGAVIVTVNHDATGKVSGYAAMESRAGWGEAAPPLLRNGDWDYALIGPDLKTRALNEAQCLACHKPMAGTSYVFTWKDLQAAAAQAQSPQAPLHR